jgi:hypothetical protein
MSSFKYHNENRPFDQVDEARVNISSFRKTEPRRAGSVDSPAIEIVGNDDTGEAGQGRRKIDRVDGGIRNT